jgi:hypothetical protein
MIMALVLDLANIVGGFLLAIAVLRRPPRVGSHLGRFAGRVAPFGRVVGIVALVAAGYYVLVHLFAGPQPTPCARARPLCRSAEPRCLGWQSTSYAQRRSRLKPRAPDGPSRQPARHLPGRTGEPSLGAHPVALRMGV